MHKTHPTCAGQLQLQFWRLEKPISLKAEEALAKAGDDYVEMYNSDMSLKQGQKDDFVQKMGLVAEPPASYPPSTWVDWMKSYGPLWVTTDSSAGPGFSPHAKIWVQIDGDGNENGKNTAFYWINPARTSAGLIKQSFSDFIVSYEEVASDNPSKGLFTQIVHYADKIPQAGADGDNDEGDDGEGFEVGGPWDLDNFSPVHENLVLSALMASQKQPLNPKTTVDGAPPDIKEVMRGVYWNDDPAIVLFDEGDFDNWNFSSGVLYGIAFKYGKDGKQYDESNTTSRTHFWDLQFFHTMGSAKGEDPADTLAKIMLWLEIAWRVATGDIDPGTKLKDVAVTSQFNTTTYKLGSFFSDHSNPKDDESLYVLLRRIPSMSTLTSHVALSGPASMPCKTPTPKAIAAVRS